MRIAQRRGVGHSFTMEAHISACLHALHEQVRAHAFSGLHEEGVQALHPLRRHWGLSCGVGVGMTGAPGEQWTMFFKDPSGNALEFKAMTNPLNLFKKYFVE